MINKKDAYIILFIVLVASFFGYNNFLHKYFIDTNNNIKYSLTTKKQHFLDTKQQYLYTVNYIENLQYENKKLQLEIVKLKNQLQQYSLDYNETQHIFPKSNSKEFIYTKPISYVDFNNLNRFYIDANISNNHIKALIFQDYVAGIARKDDTHKYPIAYLNGDQKCSYAVFIGDHKISAIIENSSTNLLKAKYIPLWEEVNIGDEVISSGLDGYFYEGYKVGKVIKITSHETYKVAFIKPYIKINNKNNFILINKN